MNAGYLVRHGLAGFLGRFCPVTPLTLTRGDLIVVHTVRGVELGEVLCPASVADGLPAGELLRSATVGDVDRQRELTGRAESLFADAVRLADDLGLPLTVLDVEVLLDGEQAVLHCVRSAECDANAFFVRLSTEVGLRVTLLDLTRTPSPKSAGCGKPGCGSGGGGCDSCGTGGGCGTNSCSRGTAKSADDLREHFLALRRQMDAQRQGERVGSEEV